MACGTLLVVALVAWGIKALIEKRKMRQEGASHHPHARINEDASYMDSLTVAMMRAKEREKEMEEEEKKRKEEEERIYEEVV